MKKRQFGKTDLWLSEIGFGAWGIGGPAMAGIIPIGWGKVDDAQSSAALKKALDQGINFYDTADFYGLGHSEALIGQVFGNRTDVIIATKVGHRLTDDQSIVLDYSKEHIFQACDSSLKRLRREVIDYYQLHSAKLLHLHQGDCLEAMQLLQEQGKIRYWGISLGTFNPYPEAEFLIQHNLAAGMQVVVNIINQRALALSKSAHELGYGIIARMPLQFGLLTGKFTVGHRFPADDHRQFRLTPKILAAALTSLDQHVWPMAQRYNIPPASLALSFVLSFSEIATVIPGIKTPEQALANTSNLMQLAPDDLDLLTDLYDTELKKVVELMEQEV